MQRISHYTCLNVDIQIILTQFHGMLQDEISKLASLFGASKAYGLAPHLPLTHG